VIPATINLRKSYNKIFVWSEKNSWHILRRAYFRRIGIDEIIVYDKISAWANPALEL
jgi:hypothetical protein